MNTLLIRWLTALFLFGISSCTYIGGVDAAVLTNNELIPDTFGEVTGEGFGGPSSGSFLCFNTNSKCFDKDSFLTQKGFEWSDTKIVFGVPGDIPISGSIIVYNTGKRSICTSGRCTVQDVISEHARLSYLIKPVIRSVNPLVWARDGQVMIRGAGFGEATGIVFFDDLNATITKWTDKELTVRAPTEGVVKRIQVQSLNGTRSVFELFSYLDQIQAPQAWPLVGNSPVVVAVIDDGLYINHPQLKSYVWKNIKEIPGNKIDDDVNGYVDDVYGYNFINNDASVDPSGSHGTRVASIILTTAQSGMAGTRSNIHIMPLVVADVNGVISSRESVIKAIKYATDNGASVINASFGSGGTTGYSKEYDEAIQYAFDHGVVVVAAAGNDDRLSKDGTDLNIVPQSPVCNNNGRLLLLGVAALDNANSAFEGKRRAQWSSYGSNCIQLAAPGVNLPGAIPPQYSSDKSSYYEQGSGTSFAAPVVSGVVAMMRVSFPLMPHWEIMNRIIASADTIENENKEHENAIGGRVNAYRALSLSSFQSSASTVVPTQSEPGNKVIVTLSHYSLQNQLRLMNDTTVIPIPSSSMKALAADVFEVQIPQDVPSGVYIFSVASASGVSIGISQAQIRILRSAIVPQNNVSQTPSAISFTTQPIQEQALLQSSESTLIDQQLSKRLSGRILLQVESQGQAWYVNPTDRKRYYMRDGESAFSILRRFGLGIRSNDLLKISQEGSVGVQKNKLVERLKGTILIDIERHGEAWYVNPINGLRYYLKNGEEAYRIMRQLGLGISNNTIHKVKIGE